jgi:peptide/nickel transport system ATP-binding protein
MSAVFGVENLSLRIGKSQILREVSWSVSPGETLGIVGESGSGKSMSVLAASGLLPKFRKNITGDAFMRIDGEKQSLIDMPPAKIRKLRGSRIGFVFQDPQSSLNPLMTVEQQLAEMIKLHMNLRGVELRRRLVELLELVGIADADRRLKAYPHELSGGMRQRVMIAIALSCDPDVLIADEPTTALDVTIQAQIVELVQSLQRKLGMAVVWISHDLSLVGQLADRIAVMYGGEILEVCETKELFSNPKHPYTQALLASKPTMDKSIKLSTIPGSTPLSTEIAERCVFYDRCQFKSDPRCATERPPLREVSENENHLVRTFCEVS